jgi:dolichol-phosphate mannosyltransferase
MAHISVVTPVCNEEGCLRELYRRLKATLETITQDFEIVMVDDGGQDRSWDVISELAEQDKRVKGLQFSRNFGQHYGITAGLDHCDGDWVVVMDCDLQDQPEAIPKLYAQVQAGYDVVLALRGKRKDAPIKRLSSWFFFKVFNYFTDMHHNSQVGNFRIMSRRVVENFRTVREQLRFIGGIVDWMGFKQTSIPVQHAERFSGKGAYNLGRQWRLAQDIIIAFSDKPLRLAIRLGFLISALALLYGLYIIYRALFLGGPVQGWPSLIVSMYFLGGIIIVILGVMGIYLGRTYNETKKRPLYIIRERKNV